MLGRVPIEHEGYERAGQTRAGTAQYRKARAGNLGRALEIDDAERCPEVPMGLRLELERRRRTVPAHFHVLRVRRSDGNARMRQIGQRQQRLRALIFDGIELDAELLDL